MTTLHIPEKVLVWWETSSGDNMAKVFRAYPYRGLYPQFFTHILVLDAPNCKSRQLEMAYDARTEHG
jgi:hypothetical protein